MTFSTCMRGKFLFGSAKNIDEMLTDAKNLVKALKEYKEQGVYLDTDKSVPEDDYYYFSTNNPEVANALEFEGITDSNLSDAG